MKGSVNMREKEDYRDNLMRINTYFPEGEMLNLTQVSKVTGLDRRTLLTTWKKEFKKIGKSEYISKCALARLMS